jgi:hypothetical protein
MKLHGVDGDVSTVEFLEGAYRTLRTLDAIAERRDGDVEGFNSQDVSCFLTLVSPGLRTAAILKFLRLYEREEDAELLAAVEEMLGGAA